MIQIIPAILATTEEDYKKRIQQIKKSGLFKDNWVQIDLMDNKFVQNKSVGPEIIAKYPVDFKLEVHLMVEDPEQWISELAKKLIRRIIFHIEIKKDKIKLIEEIKNRGLEVGLAINPETKVSELGPFLNQIDVVLIMGVHPGFQGQKFIPETIEKIKEVLRLRSESNYEFKIEVDGGVSEANAKEIVDAGADYLVVGSNLLKYDNLKEGLEKILSKIRE